MRQNNSSLLVISQSGRSLAASASRAGIPVTVIDHFADMDTQSLAVNCFPVAGDATGLDSNRIREIVTSLTGKSVTGVIAGSGLEHATDLIAELQEDPSCSYYGNSAAVWRTCSDPAAFTALLDDLDIRYPETQFDPPAVFTGWLVKQKQTAGGAHVKHLQERTARPENAYYQKYLEGRHLSVVFLANARNSEIIGISDTYVADRKQGDFRYAGAVSSVTIAPAVARQLQGIVSGLASRLALRGLCGIDVVVDDGEQCWLLELNPRPTATFELYEREQSLVAAHISACQGQMPILPVIRDCRGQQVFYTDVNLRVPSLEWPAWITDRPAPGQVIIAGGPVCTVHAQAHDPATVRQELQSRTDWLLEQFRKHRHAA